MAQIVSISHPNLSKTLAIGSRVDAQSINFNRRQQISHSWSSLQRDLKSNGKVYCLFSDNRSKDQAKKALESALGGKKIEFEKWDKEIKKREEAGGGGGGGGDGLVDQTVSTTSDVSTNDVVYSRFPTHQPA